VVYDFLTNVLAMIVVLGVLVLIHELGHFIAAKFFGIRVEVFSIGFGKRLWGFQKGETDYRVSALPLGGYVKMSGENPDEAPTGSPDEFQAKPRWQRFIVAIMGPTMNVVLSIVLLTGLYMVRFQKPAYEDAPAEIGWLEPDSPAARAGLAIGDRITRLNDKQNPTWGDVELLVAANGSQPLQVELERGGEQLTRTVQPRLEGRSELAFAGWFPIQMARLQAVEPGFPAAQAGLKEGDEIVSINGTPVLFGPSLSDLVQKSGGKPLEVVYRSCAPPGRKALDLAPDLPDSGSKSGSASPCGEEKTAQVTPSFRADPGDPQQKWRIGVLCCQSDMITRQLGFADALSESLTTNRTFAVLILDVVGKIFSRTLSPRTLEGPIGIARLSGAAARASLADLISLMAAISLNLGIINLFPIPVLDGGLILLLLIEGVIHHDLSRAVKERVTQVGFAFLMLVAVFVIYNDIVKTLPERLGRFFP
jgi:regulator of sigma E protease